MCADIECDLFDSLFGLAELIGRRELSLQIGLLFRRQVAGDDIKPAVDTLLVDPLFDMPAFIQEWDNGVVLDGAAN